MKLAQRWLPIIHAIRIFGAHSDLDRKIINFDGRDLELRCYDGLMHLDVLDAHTCEVVITFDEAGWPIWLSEWASTQMDVFVPNHFPMYSHEHYPPVIGKED